MDNFKVKKFNNGLKVLVVQNPNTDIIYYNLSLNIGHDIEKKTQLELSHFIEHLLTTYTSSKYPNAYKNRELFALHNIEEDAETDNKRMTFRLEFKKDYLDLVLDYIINSILDFKIDCKLFENERNSVIEELNEIINDGEYDFETYIYSIIYKNHSRGISQKERLKSVKKTNEKDVIHFFNKYITLNNMVLSFLGNINPTQLFKKINKLLNSQKSKKVSKEKLYTFKKINITSLNKILFFKKIAPISNIKVIFKLDYTLFDEIYYDIYAILELLAGNLNSILFKKMRSELGLIYDIETSLELDEIDKNVGYLFFSTSSNTSNILKIIESFITVFKHIKTHYISSSYIDAYINKVKIDKSKEKFVREPNKILDDYCSYLLWDKKIITSSEQYKKYSNISQKNLLKTCNDIFNFNNMIIAYTGNKNISNEINNLIN